ncbi:MAG: enoyl-CoA hydratase/isomerase family protein [Candidatus Rokuibacteriota bacterium]
MADEVLTSVEGGVATVRLNRPAKRNALNTAVLASLRAQFDLLDDDRAVRVVVVRGEGKAFCSGMDLEEMTQRQQAEADPESGVTAALRRIEQSRHPTIAMVQGDAFAGGCELALHCDLRIVADVARFCMPLARIGLVVPFILGQKLVEIIGPAHTRHLLFTGQVVEARRALEIGMVHQVVGLADLERATYETARTMAENAPLSLAGMKAVIQRAIALRDRIEHDDLDALAGYARKSADAREGERAILEKRSPRFRGD